MKKILKLLQAIQIKAWEKNVWSFEIDVRWFPDGDSGALVSIFLEEPEKWKEAHPDEESTGVNYISVPIYGDGPKLNGKPGAWHLQQVRTIAEFVGVEV